MNNSVSKILYDVNFSSLFCFDDVQSEIPEENKQKTQDEKTEAHVSGDKENVENDASLNGRNAWNDFRTVLDSRSAKDSSEVFDAYGSLSEFERLKENPERLKRVKEVGSDLNDSRWNEAYEKAKKYYSHRDAVNNALKNGTLYKGSNGLYYTWNNEENNKLGESVRYLYGSPDENSYVFNVFLNKDNFSKFIPRDFIQNRKFDNNNNFIFNDDDLKFLSTSPYSKNILGHIVESTPKGIDLDQFQQYPDLQKYYALGIRDRIKKYRDVDLRDSISEIGKGFDGSKDLAESLAYTGLTRRELPAISFLFKNNLIDAEGNPINRNAQSQTQDAPTSSSKFPDYTSRYDKIIKQEDIKFLPESLKQISQQSPSTIIWRYHPSFESGVYLVQDPKNPKFWRQYKEDGTAIGSFGGKATPFKLESGVRVNPQEHQQELEQIENWRNLSKFGNRVDLEEIRDRENSLGEGYTVDSSGNVHTNEGTLSLDAWATKHGFNPFDYSKTTDVIDKSGKLTPRAQRYIERYNAMSPEQKAAYDSQNPWFKQFLAGVNRSENSALNRTIAQPGLKWKDWSDTQKFGTMAGLGLGSLAFMSMLGKNKKDWLDYLMMLGVPIASIFGGSYLGNYLDPRTNPGTYNAKAYADYIKNAQKQAAAAAKAANNAASGNK